jgi:polyhydroxyalkanoate synthesis repressor PhaR
MAEPAAAAEKAPITIKKYANRRLYNTATSSYVTLDHLCQMVKDGVDFVVFDAKSGEDITRSVLTQIIVEEESKGGQNLLPINFLRQLISFYGDNLQFLLPRYLEQSMDSFATNQEQMRKYLKDSLGGMFPFGRFEELGKQNMAFLEHAMRMWAPFKIPPVPNARARRRRSRIGGRREPGCAEGPDECPAAAARAAGEEERGLVPASLTR